MERVNRNNISYSKQSQFNRNDTNTTQSTQRRNQNNNYANNKFEQGIVASIKDNYGFIKCVEQDDIYFSLSQAPRDIKIGNEVEFLVYENKGRFSANKLSLLPKGTVKFEEIFPGVHKGIVNHQLMIGYGGKGGKGGGKGGGATRDGSIKFQEEEGGGGGEGMESNGLISFGVKDIFRIGTKLFKGDEVEFEICQEIKNKRRRATNIKVLRTALEIELANCPKEEGIILALKDGFGFLQATTRTNHVYFRFEDIVDSALKLEIGNEVSFICRLERPRPSSSSQENGPPAVEKYRASHLSSLPKGSVTFEELISTATKGLVSRRASEGGGGGGNRMMQPIHGCIVVSLPSSSDNRDSVNSVNESEVIKVDDNNNPLQADVEAIFKTSDVIKQFNLRNGDEVLLDVYRHKASKTYFGRNISILQLTSQHREHGVVSSLKEGFGFIKCCEREEDLYFRLTEYMDDDMAPLQVELEVEFDVAANDRSLSRSNHPQKHPQLQAERIQLLMEGTVWFEAAVASDLQGVILSEPRNGRPGMIKCDEIPELSTESEFLDVWRKVEEFLQDESSQKLIVSFLSGPRHVEAYVAVAKELKVGYTLGKDGKEIFLYKFKTDEEKASFIGAKPRSVMLNTNSAITYTQDQVPVDNPVCKADIVTFSLVINRRSLRRCAKEIILKERPALKLAPAPDGTERSLKFTNPRKMRLANNEEQSLNNIVYREAVGPDKSLGFAPGWRDRLRNGGPLSETEEGTKEEVEEEESVEGETTDPAPNKEHDGSVPNEPPFDQAPTR